MPDDLIQQAISTIRAGDRTNGQRILAQVLDKNPKNEAAWLWLSVCVNSTDQKIHCLKKAIEINPSNQNAIQALADLEKQTNLTPTLDEIRKTSHQNIASISDKSPINNQIPEAFPLYNSNHIRQNDFITLTCPSCGGKLQVKEDTEHFYCSYCGNEHIVRRQGGIVKLEPVIQEIKKVNNNINGIRSSVDITNSELAIARLRNDIEELQAKKKKIIERISLMIKPISALGILAIFLVPLTFADSKSIGCLIIPDIFVVIFLLICIISILNGVRERREIQSEIEYKDSEIALNLKIVRGYK
jgi:predicted RNA-binding Zn-ribbon protein involved in translation (DUF1610 family)